MAKRKSKSKAVKITVRKKGPAYLQNPTSRTYAVHAFCRECIYDPNESGSWRKQVEKCTATSCPLFNFRPMTVEAVRDAAAKKKAARKRKKK